MKNIGLRRLFLFVAVGLLAIVPLGVCAFEAATPTADQVSRCQRMPDPNLQAFCIKGYEVTGLNLPKEEVSFGTFSTAGSMALYKPDGVGPFPAVIVMHTCGTIVPMQTRFWVAAAIANGYAAFVLDSWTQRGLPNGSCDVSPGFATISVRVRDAYDALARLTEIPDIDADRVAVVGFSHGGRIAYLLANAATSKMFSRGGRPFAAAVAVYGECFNRPTKTAYLRAPIDTPLLALLGDRDEDGDVRECEPRLKAAKESGSPVDWHIFPGAGHAWDQPNFSSSQMRPYNGSPSGSVLYKYDVGVTNASRDRAFAFLNARLKK